MNNNAFIGIMTGIGFALAAWSYPVVSPMLDRMFNPTYNCTVEYFLPNKMPQERTTEVLKSELQVGKYVRGFQVVQAHYVEDKFFGMAYHPVYNVVQLKCNLKEKV